MLYPEPCPRNPEPFLPPYTFFLLPFTLEGMEDLLERLGNHLVWRIGKAEGEELLVVRVGLATAAGEFSHLSRLRNVTDEEIELLAKAGQVRVEWVN